MAGAKGDLSGGIFMGCFRKNGNGRKRTIEYRDRRRVC